MSRLLWSGRQMMMSVATSNHQSRETLIHRVLQASSGKKQTRSKIRKNQLN